MMPVIVSGVALLVGYVIYKERRISLVTCSALWLGFAMLILISGGKPLPPGVVWIGLAVSAAAIGCLCKRFPMFFLFIVCLISGLLSRGDAGYYRPLYFYRRRWW